MTTTYFKRYRMEVDLSGRELKEIAAPAGYRLLAWHPELLEAHALAKFLSFCDELDSNVFPCLGERSGCLRLMREITSKSSFIPQATWLAVFDDPEAEQIEYCGTIQGIDSSKGYGSIQNLGVVERHRGQGLGSCLLCRALEGFCSSGLPRVSLEVTAENRDAIRLYRHHGFKAVKTVFKAAEVAYL
jgi:ribosomal protein S18 acetylase RimI-like enzyme